MPVAPADPIRVALPPEAESVPAARRVAEGVAERLLSPIQLEKLRLALSEVVTNAVLHGGAAEHIRLALTPREGYLCVQVTDGGTGFAPSPGAIGNAEGGYGLFLVEETVRRWGLTREGGRTRVWFELDYEEPGAGTGRRA